MTEWDDSPTYGDLQSPSAAKLKAEIDGWRPGHLNTMTAQSLGPVEMGKQNSSGPGVPASRFEPVERRRSEPVPGVYVAKESHSIFQVKDSGKRQEFDSGMVRDTQEGKVEYDRIFDGPLADRWAALLTKAATEKYHDDPDGTPNWMKANGREELKRFRKSAARHFRQWLRGDQDEDHAAAVVFNMNGYERVKEQMKK